MQDSTSGECAEDRSLISCALRTVISTWLNSSDLETDRSGQQHINPPTNSEKRPSQGGHDIERDEEDRMRTGSAGLPKCESKFFRGRSGWAAPLSSLHFYAGNRLWEEICQNKA